jgi:hypothetical protein
MARRQGSSAVDVWYEMAHLGVPPDAVLSVRKGWDTTALSAAKKFEIAPADIARTLVLAGARGCGKTTAAAHVVWHWARGHSWNNQASGGKQHRPCVWVDAAEVTAQTDFGRVDPEWLEGLRRAKLLIIDDLGEDGTQPGLAALADVLKARHEWRRRTVITSNLSLPKMEQRYGESWYERLRVAALAPDLRQAKSLRNKLGAA